MRINGATRSPGGVSETSGSTIGPVRAYSLTTTYATRRQIYQCGTPVQFLHPSKTYSFVLRCRSAPTPILSYSQPLLHAEPKSSRQTTDSLYGYGRLAINQAVLTVVLYLFLVQFRQWSHSGLAPRALRRAPLVVSRWKLLPSYPRAASHPRKCGSGQTRGSPRLSGYPTFHTRRGRISVFRSP